MLRIAQFDIDQKPKEIRFSVYKTQIGNIGVLLSDQCANTPQHTSIVPNRDVEGGDVNRGVGSIMPAQIKPTFRLILKSLKRIAIDRVNDNPSAPIRYTDDPLTG